MLFILPQETARGDTRKVKRTLQGWARHANTLMSSDDSKGGHSDCLGDLWQEDVPGEGEEYRDIVVILQDCRRF